MNSLGEFLRIRRGRLRPEQVGLPAGNGRRQTPGLRREELAAVAGVSVDYYTRIEQGRDTHPSEAVLDALAAALRLERDEREYLQKLAHRPPHQTKRIDTARPRLVQLLEQVRPTPAYVLDRTSTVLAANAEGLLLLAGIDEWPPTERNLARYVFTHRAARRVIGSWQRVAEDCVANLRTVTPDDPQLAALVTELSAASVDFARLWGHYDVRAKRSARRVFHHPAVGRLELTSEILTATDGQRFVIFQADPGTPGQDALRLLDASLFSDAGLQAEGHLAGQVGEAGHQHTE